MGLACGAARWVITPPAEIMSGLYGLGKRRFSGEVISDLHLRILVLQSGDRRVLMAAYELDKVPCPERFLRVCMETAEIPEENILLFSTHVHTAPVCGVRPDEPMNDDARRDAAARDASERYIAWLLRSTEEAVQEALSCLRPARMGWAEGNSYINVNRLQDYAVEESEEGPAGRVTARGINFEGPVDHTAFVMRLEDGKGQPVAFFVNYAVHNVAMIGARSGENGGLPICADIAGEVSCLLEQRYPGAVAIWSSGAAGDINPVLYNEFIWPDERTGLGTVKQPQGIETAMLALKMMSRQHFDDVVRINRKIRCMGKAEAKGCAGGISRTPGCNRERTPEGGITVISGTDVPPYEIRENMLLVGDILFCGFSGELFTTLGKAVQQAVPEKRVVVINHHLSLMTNAGYIFDDNTLQRMDSSVRRVHIPGYGAESHLISGTVRDSLVNVTRNLYQKITKDDQ